MNHPEDHNSDEAPMNAGMSTGRKKYSEPIVPGFDPDETAEKGLVCPDCGCSHFRVIYTRPAARGRIQRRRECRHCGRRVTTMESATDVAKSK